MPISQPITRRFSGTRFSKESFNWSATESWDCVGFADKNDAIEAACPAQTGGAPTPHPDNPSMVVHRRWAEPNKGPLCWIVYAEFKFGDPGLCADSPLNENPKLIWDFSIKPIPVEYDVDGNPILNSAGQPYDPPLTTNITVPAIIVRKFLPSFNVGTYLPYMNTDNTASFSIAGAGSVDAGQAYCNYIKPIEFYTLAAPWCQVEFRFEFLPGTNPFQQHPIDQGRMGWYGSPTAVKGPICDGTGTPVSFDVRLDGTGKPIDSHFYILGADGTKQTPVATPTASKPAGLSIETALSSAQLKVLIWNVQGHKDFSGLI